MESSEPLKYYETWTIDDVGKWLDKTVCLPQYKPIFEDLAIDGSLLAHIMDEDLQNDFQMRIRLHRIKVIEAIKKLNSESTKKIDIELTRQTSTELVDLDRSYNLKNNCDVSRGKL
jgi:hypothetical protein